MFHKTVASLLAVTVVISSVGIPKVHAMEVSVPLMPKPGTMVNLSPAFTPAQLQGITIHKDNALQFDFLVNKGDENLNEEQKKQEYKRLVKYFLAALTVSNKDQWVNLSPYENSRIIQDDFGKTEMGRDLLAQDYLLKQITSSLMYPESGLGKKFWNNIYERAQKEFGTTNIPVNAFNKVWIMPEEAAVYESGNTVYILKSHLKVMLEEDYLALSKTGVTTSAAKKSSMISSQIIKEILLPELEREVNEGKNFAQLRQVISGMVLATWFKQSLKESLLGKVYVNQAKIGGVIQVDSMANKRIYEQYLSAFKKGVYSYIKEEKDPFNKQSISRKYFSGGVVSPAQVAIYKLDSKIPFRTIRAGALAVDLDKIRVALKAYNNPAMINFSRLKVRPLIVSLILGGQAAILAHEINVLLLGGMRFVETPVAFAIAGIAIWGVHKLELRRNKTKNEAMLASRPRALLILAIAMSLPGSITAHAQSFIEGITPLAEEEYADLTDQVTVAFITGQLSKYLERLPFDEDRANAVRLLLNRLLNAVDEKFIAMFPRGIFRTDLAELRKRNELVEAAGSVSLGNDYLARVVSVFSEEKYSIHWKRAIWDIIEGHAEKNDEFPLEEFRGLVLGVDKIAPALSKHVKGPYLDQESLPAEAKAFFQKRFGEFIKLLPEQERPERLRQLFEQLIKINRPLLPRDVSELEGHLMEHIKDKDLLNESVSLLTRFLLNHSMRISHSRAIVDIIRSWQKKHGLNLFSWENDLREYPFLDPKVKKLLFPEFQDLAMLTQKSTPGGIDVNADHMKFKIKRDAKTGMELPFSKQDPAQMNGLTGFEPEILEIRNMPVVPILSELKHKLEESRMAVAVVS